MSRTLSFLEIDEAIENGEISFAFLSDLGLDQQGEISNMISEMTHTDDTVLDLTPDEVLNKACFALLFDEDGQVISMVSITKPEVNRFGYNVGEIGTMFTLPEHQCFGYATYLVHRIDEWAKENNYDGAYAFLNGKSPKSFAVNNYSAIVEVDLEYQPVIIRGKRTLFSGITINNAADFVPDCAIELCKTVCCDPHAMELFELDRQWDWLMREVESRELLISEYATLSSIRATLNTHHQLRAKRFDEEKEKLLRKIDKLDPSDDANFAAYTKIIDFYNENLDNNLRCCDVVVAKVY